MFHRWGNVLRKQEFILDLDLPHIEEYNALRSYEKTQKEYPRHSLGLYSMYILTKGGVGSTYSIEH